MGSVFIDYLGFELLAGALKIITDDINEGEEESKGK
jgi:hypothetical protein